MDGRLARVLLPAGLLRDVDELVLSGRGGYSSRQEFFLEAVQNHVLEVKHGVTDRGQLLIDGHIGGEGVAEVEAGHASGSGNGRPQRTSEVSGAGEKIESPVLPPAWTEGYPVEPISEIEQTALRTPPRGVAVEDGIGRFKKEPLLGLHNRDYPSIWAARLLGEMTASEPLPAPQFLEEATKQAWRYARALLDLEKQTKVKLTALFPTNTSKPQSAEEGFRAFAIGTIARRPAADGGFDTAGPLFSWKVCQLVKPNGTLHIGLTEVGWALLEVLDGLTLAWPHDREYAERFFKHLRQHAPWDWEGLEQVIGAVAESPTRPELAAHFQRWQPEWSEATANSNSAGFVARAREWGLIEPKLVDGHYVLTDFGETTHHERSAA